jgi:hypothetical protein
MNSDSDTIEVRRLIDYEEGRLSGHEVLELFSEMIKSGLAWKLQGHYGRTAVKLIKSGYIDRGGNILIPEAWR